MAEFVSLNEHDTKELRKEIGLPITKPLVYWKKIDTEWHSYIVVNYEIAEIYKPSNTFSLFVTIESGEKVRILGDFFVDMQKTTFLSDIEKNNL